MLFTFHFAFIPYFIDFQAVFEHSSLPRRTSLLVVTFRHLGITKTPSTQSLSSNFETPSSTGLFLAHTQSPSLP